MKLLYLNILFLLLLGSCNEDYEFPLTNNKITKNVLVEGIPTTKVTITQYLNPNSSDGVLDKRSTITFQGLTSADSFTYKYWIGFYNSDSFSYNSLERLFYDTVTIIKDSTREFQIREPEKYIAENRLAVYAIDEARAFNGFYTGQASFNENDSNSVGSSIKLVQVWIDASLSITGELNDNDYRKIDGQFLIAADTVMSASLYNKDNAAVSTLLLERIAYDSLRLQTQFYFKLGTPFNHYNYLTLYLVKN